MKHLLNLHLAHTPKHVTRFRLTAILSIIVATLVPLAVSPVYAATGQTYYYSQQMLKFAQNTTTLSYAIPASTQVDESNIGPAYLLNGLTDTGYWYQLGFSYNLANDPKNNYFGEGGFRVVVNNFAPGGSKITQDSHYVPLNGPVNAGDTIDLNLSLVASQVLMSVIDVTTGSSIAYTYNSPLATTFVAQPNPGTFTGPMTEWHHLSMAGYSDTATMTYTPLLPTEAVPAVMAIHESKNVVTPGSPITQTSLYYGASPLVTPDQNATFTHSALSEQYSLPGSFTTQ